MDRAFRRHGHLVAALGLLAVITSGIGCTSLATTAAYLIKGTDVDPDFGGLEEKKVLVVCRPATSLTFQDSEVARDLAREVSRLLAANVKKVEVIEHRKVADWLDNNYDWSEFAEVGEAFDVDFVVGIDLGDFGIYQGQTLYQGRADATITVCDCKAGGKEVFEKPMPQSLYPPSGGVESSSMPEKQFRRRFIGIVARQIACHFYPHDPRDNFAPDATILD